MATPANAPQKLNDKVGPHHMRRQTVRGNNSGNAHGVTRWILPATSNGITTGGLFFVGRIYAVELSKQTRPEVADSRPSPDLLGHLLNNLAWQLE